MIMTSHSRPNWFNTLNEALLSENLLHMWDGCTFPSIEYGETRSWKFDDGTRYGHFVSIYRETDGRYERPVHYQC